MPFVNSDRGPASDDSSGAGPRPGMGPGGGPLAATDLARTRKQLTEATGAGRLDAPGLRQVLVDLHEFWLTSKAAELGIRPHSGLAIVAVGGLGRGEMLPHSDLDLILLHDDLAVERLSEVADGLWYPLWDANIPLDHSVRTVPQALQVAAEDTTAALGLLEARHIVGDEDLSSLLIGGVRQQWRTEIRHRFPEVVEHAQDRWRRAGDIAHRAEPDLKNGRGGLRDVQLLGALAIAQLTDGMGGLRPDSPNAGPQMAYHRLLDIRTELHRIAGRPREQVRAQDADEMGASLRIGDRFDLARVISDSARTISYSIDVGLRTAGNALPRRGLSKLRRSPIRRPLDEGVVEHNGEIVLARNAIPSKDPGLILRVASASARTGLPISASTLSRLADYAPELREPWPAEALSDLLVLLGSGHHMIDPIEALDRTGLWGRLLPEWGAVRDLPPRDAVHTWTVDRHLVETAAYASSMTTRVSRPDLLVLGALIHDLGKGRGADHSIVGAELAVQVGNRFGLWPQDVDVLSELVRHHLLLPSIATRRDLDDPATATEVAETLGYDRVLLELLAALAEADSRATGPGVWGEWKASLINDLVRRTMRLIDGETPEEPEPLSAQTRALAESGEYAVSITQGEGPHTFTVVMVAPDTPGLLSKMAGVVALNGLRSHSATVQGIETSDGQRRAVNTFVVVPTFGSPPEAGLLRQQLIAAVEGKIDVIERLDARESSSPIPTIGSVNAAPGIGAGAAAGSTDPAVDGAGHPKNAVPALFAIAPPRVLWASAPSDDEVLMELRTDDRLGLLSRVSKVIEQQGADVRWAKVTTLGPTVVDNFCLRLADDTPQARTALADAVIVACPPPQPRSEDDSDGGSAGTTGSGRSGVPIS
ncbi:[protein-PII] uridylyltransferase [Gordonia sputi]|uniref:Bifunctional uridylyltransferase/uridylyl-removing enzyme n=1 Tax=Gordonia sputi NBRC 100414 TaxID=1089453 RepID=H5TZA9_9ACTN|nr:[protein-PII] uridylyltransferase [Gordonia sputi]NKY93968.1 [protein-PII] uridylyltransferase [Gordonia sputi]GAB38817.1 PII uridylyltransferase [Gordonia sputi NBRC 100414]